MRALVASSALSLLLTVPLAAQTVRGVLSDDVTGRPIVAGKITLLQETKSQGTVTTDSTGAFAVEAASDGHFRLKAEALGFTTLTTDTFRVAVGEEVQVELRMAADAIPLEPLTVTTRSFPPSPYLVASGFYDRKRAGIGTFLTRADWADRSFSRLSDIFRRMPGMHIDPMGSSGRGSASRSGRSVSRCQPLLVLDGVITTIGGHSRADIPLDDVINIADIEGLELYRGSSEVPMQFNVHTGDCGALLIWTRRR